MRLRSPLPSNLPNQRTIPAYRAPPSSQSTKDKSRRPSHHPSSLHTSLLSHSLSIHSLAPINISDIKNLLITPHPLFSAGRRTASHYPRCNGSSSNSPSTILVIASKDVRSNHSLHTHPPHPLLQRPTTMSRRTLPPGKLLPRPTNTSHLSTNKERRPHKIDIFLRACPHSNRNRRSRNCAPTRNASYPS